MEYAIIESGGKQYKVERGTVLDIDKIFSKGSEIIFDKVLLTVSNGEVKIGKPYVSSLAVKGKVIGDKKGEKIRVSKFKSKVRYRKTIGFRASLTSVEILSIGEKISSKKEEKSK